MTASKDRQQLQQMIVENQLRWEPRAVEPHVATIEANRHAKVVATNVDERNAALLTWANETFHYCKLWDYYDLIVDQVYPPVQLPVRIDGHGIPFTRINTNRLEVEPHGSPILVPLFLARFKDDEYELYDDAGDRLVFDSFEEMKGKLMAIAWTLDPERLKKAFDRFSDWSNSKSAK